MKRTVVRRIVVVRNDVLAVFVTHERILSPDLLASSLDVAPNNDHRDIDEVQDDQSSGFPLFQLTVPKHKEHKDYRECEESNIPEKGTFLNSEWLDNTH